MRRGEDHEYINVMFSSTITQTAMKWEEKMYVHCTHTILETAVTIFCPHDELSFNLKGHR